MVPTKGISKQDYSEDFYLNITQDMHPLWFNQDVLNLIFDVLDKSGRKRTLAALARTCRLIYEPAMDALWSTLNDVSPLIKCMPESAWKVSKMPLGLGRQRPVLSLANTKPSDWEYFARHAHRVRELVVSTSGSRETSISGFLLSALCTYALECAARSRPLFPMLHSLSCDIYTTNSECLSCIPYISGPDLSLLRLRTNSSTVTVSRCLSPLPEILNCVRANIPSLCELEVSLRPAYQLPESSVAFGQAMVAFPVDQFSSLTVHLEFPKEILYHISLGKRLTTLDITMHHIRKSDLHFDGAPVFAAVENLAFHVGHADVASAFVGAITSQKLVALEVHCESFGDGLAVFDLCRVIARHRNLRTLALYSMPGFSLAALDDARRFDMLEALQPLLTLSHMESFTLDGTLYVDIHGEYLKSLGNGWPQLQSLTLAINPPSGIRAWVMPTIHALRYIPEHFPHLVTLGISVSQIVPYPEGLREKNGTQSGLRAIHFYASPLFHFAPLPQGSMNGEPPRELLDPDKLADFLHTLFPSLSMVQGPPATGPWWPTVYSHLLSIKFRSTS